MHTTFLNRVVFLFSFLLLTTSVIASHGVGRNVQFGRPAPHIRNSVTGDTNAKRLAKGLPLLPPTRRSGTDSESYFISFLDVLCANAAGCHRVWWLAAKKAKPSYTPYKLMGGIQCTDSKGTVLGFLSYSEGR